MCKIPFTSGIFQISNFGNTKFDVSCFPLNKIKQTSKIQLCIECIVPEKFNRKE